MFLKKLKDSNCETILKRIEDKEDEEDTKYWEKYFEFNFTPLLIKKSIKHPRDINVFIGLLKSRQANIINSLPTEIMEHVFEYVKYNAYNSHISLKSPSNETVINFTENDVVKSQREYEKAKLKTIDNLIVSKEFNLFQKLPFEIRLNIRNLIAKNLEFSIKKIDLSSVPNNWEDLL